MGLEKTILSIIFIFPICIAEPAQAASCFGSFLSSLVPEVPMVEVLPTGNPSQPTYTLTLKGTPAERSHQRTVFRSRNLLPKQVEIETPVTETSMALTTTANGTLRPLIEILGTIPEGIQKIFPNLSMEQMSDLKWKDLSLDGKKEFLIGLGRMPTSDFLKDRRIPGLRLQTGLKGSHFQFEESIEWVSAHEMIHGPSTIEIHVTIKGKPSFVAKTAFDLQTQLGLMRLPIHIHALAFVDPYREAVEPIDRATGSILFTSVVDKMLQMKETLEGFPIPAQSPSTTFPSGGNPVLFGALDGPRITDQMAVVYRQLTGRDYKGIPVNLGIPISRLKGYFGYAGKGFYRDPSLHGIEFRIVEPRQSEIELAEMDQIYEAFIQRGSALPPRATEEWLESTFDARQVPAPVRDQMEPRFVNALTALTWSQPHPAISVLKSMTRAEYEFHLRKKNHWVSAFFEPDPRSPQGEFHLRQKRWVSEVLKTQLNLGFLLHRWDLDPIPFALGPQHRGPFLDQISALQTKYAHALNDFVENSGKPRNLSEIQEEALRLTSDFLKASELFFLYRKVLGLND